MSERRIILIAGWAHRSGELRFLANELPSSWQIDMTSTCELLTSSGMDKRETGVSAYAAALNEMADGRECIVVGWSMGAMVAVEALAELGMPLSGMVALSSTARFCSTENYDCGINPANLRALRAGVKHAPERTLERFCADVFAPETVPQNLIGGKVDAALSFGLDVLDHGLQYLGETDLRARLGGITTPMLVIHGGEDRIVPWRSGKYIAENVPGAAFILRDGAGHGTLLKDVRELAALVEEFVKELN